MHEWSGKPDTKISRGTYVVTRRRMGFSLIELIVVLGVTAVLTSLLLPTLSQVRENLHRVLCSSNLRQIGLGIHMYAREHNEQLPPSWQLEQRQLAELTMARLDDTRIGWDGLGLLYAQGYCKAPGCYYCPSHIGQHTQEYKPIGHR